MSRGSWRHSDPRRAATKRRAKEKRLRDEEAKRAKGKWGHRQCGRKRRFPDEVSVMVEAQRISNVSGTDLRYYHCDICGGWHLTKRRG